MNVYEEKIRDNFKFFGGISFLYGVLFAFCMYRNLFGATFLLYAAATVFVLGKFLKKMEIIIRKETKLYFGAIFLCGISTCFTSSEFLQLCNWCCMICLLLLAMGTQLSESKKWGFLSYFVNLASLFFSTIGYSFLSFRETKKCFQGEKKERNKNVSFVIIGVISAVCVLVIVLPLLISSDAVFGHIAGRAFSYLRFANILPNMTTGIGILITVMLGFMFMYGFFYASCHADFDSERRREMPIYPAVAGISFTVVIALVYVLYSGIQIIFLFFQNAGGLPNGMTYSEYAHSGFWQLVAVAVINIVMVLFCMYLFAPDRILKGLLTLISLCTFVMMASAAYRMYLYVRSYQLTFLRLLVFWFLLILALIMAGVIVTIYKEGFPFIRYGIMITVCGYLLFTLIRPDYLIASYNVSQPEKMQKEDVQYLMYGLSLDAAPVIATIDAQKLYPSDVPIVQEEMYSYFREIEDQNQGIYFRKANYSRIVAKHTAEEYLESHAEYGWY